MHLLHLLLTHSEATILTHALDVVARLLFVFMVHTVARLTSHFRWPTSKTMRVTLPNNLKQTLRYQL